MTAKEYLKQIRSIALTVKRIQGDLEKLKTDAESVSINLDGMPHATGNNDRLVRLAIKMSEYNTMLQAELTALLDERVKADKIIKTLPPKQQTVLVEYYFHVKKWEQIAEEMDISVRHCHRLHGNALYNFDKVLRNY